MLGGPAPETRSGRSEEERVEDISPGGGSSTPAGQVSDRMQALLSRAVEEQVSEQRAVSSLLAEIRAQVTALGEDVRSAGPGEELGRLEGAVGTLVSDLRTATSVLGQRIEALGGRVEESGAGLAGFPASLSAVQRDLAGVHDRLAGVAELQARLDDLAARTASTWDTVSPQLASLQEALERLGEVPDPDRLRDAVVDGVSARLQRLESAVSAPAAPAVTPERLTAVVEGLRSRLDDVLTTELDNLGALVTGRFGALEEKVGALDERLAALRAGGVQDEVRGLGEQVGQLAALPDQVAALGELLSDLRESLPMTALTESLAGLREDVDALGERLETGATPTADEVASLVSQRVADRLVESLAPRVAELVVGRVTEELAGSLVGALEPVLRADRDGTAELLRATAEDSEQRIIGHVDEAVLALAEALLRRRRNGSAGRELVATPAEEVAAESEETEAVGQPQRPVTDATEGPDPEPEDVPEPEPEREPEAGLDEPEPEAEAAAEVPAGDALPSRGSAGPIGRPAVTTSLAPRPERPAAAGAVPESEPEREPEPEPEPEWEPEPEPEPESAPPAVRSSGWVRDLSPTEPPAGKRRPWWRPGG